MKLFENYGDAARKGVIAIKIDAQQYTNPLIQPLYSVDEAPAVASCSQ